MARPRKYHTPDEERLARNARSRRSYAKHQPSIRKRRNKLYHSEASAARSSKTTERSDLGETTNIPECSDEKNLAFWVRKAGKIDVKVTKVMGTDERAYYEGILERYLQFGEDNLINTVIEDACNQFDELLNQMRHCEDAILQLAGVDKEWYRVEEMAKKIIRISRNLNDMNAYSLLPAGELSVAHKKRELMYQTP